MKETGSLNTVVDLTWDQVARRLAAGAPAILPIGAGAKQHGLHMTMATDQVFAEYFAGVLAEKIDALIWPTLTMAPIPLSSLTPEVRACPMRLSKRSSPRSPVGFWGSARDACSFSIPASRPSHLSRRRSTRRQTRRGSGI
jgi:creatinine amidohydrolase/Fe(II)-dependent formamide hydrolase-like protein